MRATPSTKHLALHPDDIAAGLPVTIDDGSQYVYGAGLEEMVAGGNTYYYLADGLGSTMAIVDATGAVQKSYTYDVYGEPTATGTLANEFDFAGQQTDPTGLQYLRARYMDPETGTFMSRDPLAAASGWLDSPFGYASQDPVGLVDPTGTCNRRFFPCVPSCLFFECPGRDDVKDLWNPIAHWTSQVRAGLITLGEYGRRAWQAASGYLTDKFHDPLFQLSVLAALSGIGTDLACGAMPVTLGGSLPLCAGFILTTASLLTARAQKVSEMRQNGEIGPSEASCEVVSDVVGAAGTGAGAFTDLVVGELACDAIGAGFD